ncbi:Periodic tryptophan protein 2 -like protein, partial [Toxocara canis]
FSSLIGTVYRSGNVVFTPDGNSLLSPVGNKVTAFDLKNNVASTIPVESDQNIKVVALNPPGTHMFIVNEGGEGLYVNLSTQTVLYRHRFHRHVGDVKFSPDGRRIAACRDGDVQIFSVAGFQAYQFNPFVLQETYKVTASKVKHLDWSYDSKLVAAASEDKQVRIMAAGGKLQNLFMHTLAAHKGAVITSHFCHNSYDLLTVDKRGLANFWTCALTADDLLKGICNSETPDHVKKMRFEKAKRVSELAVRTLSVNKSGDWLAIGCGKGTDAQLVVWEWQSETYIMKQQSHSQTITTVAYSPDGSMIATGAEDGKAKVWNCRSSFCIVTFTEHTSGVSAVCWTPDGKALLSSSLDGTVRAHDLQRYRNFRTLVCPEQTQLGALAVDSAGDLVVSASIDAYNIFVWSLENGRLLDMLSGHSAPIAAISLHGTSLVSASWDKTMRIWNVVESASAETIELTDEALDVAFSPSGQNIAVLCLDGSLTLFDGESLTEWGSINTKLDVDAARSVTELIKKETSEKSKPFTCICFSADGAFLLAAGRSNYICMYNVAERVIVKKFKLTTNRSLDGVTLDINRRNLSEFGNMSLIDASDSDDEPDGRKRIKLAGTRHSDLAERCAKPEMRVQHIGFSPTGRSFAVCSTEGVCVFSQEHRTVFDPYELNVDVTPQRIRQAVGEGEYSLALVMAIRLNETELLEETVLMTPLAQRYLVAPNEAPWGFKVPGFLNSDEEALEETRCDQNTYTLEYLVTARRMKRV